jgi:TPR repeat protein
MFEPRRASTELGLMYMKGNGVKQNDKIAFEHFNNAVGHSVAMYYVGKYYEEGKIVPKDLAKAFENYENSYNKGYKPAQKAMQRLKKLIDKLQNK